MYGLLSVVLVVENGKTFHCLGVEKPGRAATLVSKQTTEQEIQLSSKPAAKNNEKPKVSRKNRAEGQSETNKPLTGFFHSFNPSNQSAQCCIISRRCGRCRAWLYAARTLLPSAWAKARSITSGGQPCSLRFVLAMPRKP